MPRVYEFQDAAKPMIFIGLVQNSPSCRNFNPRLRMAAPAAAFGLQQKKSLFQTGEFMGQVIKPKNTTLNSIGQPGRISKEGLENQAKEFIDEVDEVEPPLGKLNSHVRQLISDGSDRLAVHGAQDRLLIFFGRQEVG
jgi:hypothetical protein